MRAWSVTILLIATSSWSQAPANRVLSLDGEAAYVELPVAAFAGLNEATIEAWVRYDSWDAFSQWLAYGTGPWRAWGINHFDTSTALQFFVYGTGVGDLHVISTTVPQKSGMWLHQAAVCGSDGMRFYVNGLLVGSNTYAGGLVIHPGSIAGY